jgi:predicted metal-dependent phosphotriesterase family hydrolase
MRTAPQKFVRVKPHIKARDLGCTQPHFHIYIKDEPLRVIEETREEYTVKDGADHPWILKKEDVELVQAKVEAHV